MASGHAPAARVLDMGAMTEFDDAIAFVARADGEYAGHLPGTWAIGGAVNGGLTMALMAAVLGDRLGRNGGHVEPLALSAYFMSAASGDDVVLRTESLRTGRTMSTGQVTLHQQVDGRLVERTRATATFGDLARWSEPVLRGSEPPGLPGPDECVAATVQPVGFEVPPLMDRLDLRFHPDDVGWALGSPSGRGRLRAWLRFADGREPDAVSLLFFLDAMPPVAFDLGILGWAPTLEFTGYVRARPAPGWLRAEMSTQNVAGGLLEEDAVVWDSTGRVVAQSRQLAAVRFPPGLTVPGAASNG